MLGAYPSRHLIPLAIRVNPTDWPAHDVELELNAEARRLLTDQRLGTILRVQASLDEQPPLEFVSIIPEAEA
jgi:hypothetical protein